MLVSDKLGDDTLKSRRARDGVVLLHGLGRSSSVMGKLECHLKARNLQTYNIDYPSTRYSVEKLAEIVLGKVNSIVNQANTFRLHWVGHSLGCIIIRYLFQHNIIETRGRVVMIAPPNQGTLVADVACHIGAAKIFGPVLKQLSAKKDGFIHSLEMPQFEFGVIAGDRSLDKLFSWFILQGPNDGKVTIESTMLKTMTDHWIVHASHSILPSHKEVLQQTEFFLTYGSFQHSK